MGAISAMNTAIKNNKIVRDKALKKYFSKNKYAFEKPSDDLLKRLPEDPVHLLRLNKAEKLRKRKEVQLFLFLLLILLLSSVFAIALLKGIIQLPQLNLWFDSVFGNG